MAFCENCGKSLRAGARFCGACGAAMPQEDAAQPPATPPNEATWSCPACAAANQAESLFCYRCGARREAAPQPAAAAAATTAVLSAPVAEQGHPDTQDTEITEAAPSDDARAGGWRKKTWSVVRKPWVLAFVAVLVFVAAAGVFMLAEHRGHVDKAQAAEAFNSQSHTIVSSLAPMTIALETSLPSSVATCAWSTKLSVAVRDAGRLQSSLVQSQNDCAKLQTSTASQAAVKQALAGVLSALATYTTALSNLPAQLSEVTATQAQTVQTDAAAATAACQHLQSLDSQMQSLPIASCRTLAAGAAKASRDVALRTFLIRTQNDILDQSQYGRQDIVNAVNGVNGMTMNPNDAANQIQSVQSNRQSLLDQLSAMNVPDDSRATGLLSLLQQSLQHSIEADRDYAAWMNDIYNYYWEDPVGYMGNVPHTADYNAAVSQSAMANAAKSSFCSRYNRLARLFGLKHDWQASQI